MRKLLKSLKRKLFAPPPNVIPLHLARDSYRRSYAEQLDFQDRYIRKLSRQG